MKKLFLALLSIVIISTPCFSWAVINSDNNINIRIEQKIDSFDYHDIDITKDLKVMHIKNKDIFAENLDNFLKIENNIDELKDILKADERLEQKLDSEYFIEYNYTEKYNIEIPNGGILNIIPDNIYEKRDARLS